jgi:ABC-type phosphate/phosphonate transport system ATPase subunit
VAGKTTALRCVPYVAGKTTALRCVPYVAGKTTALHCVPYVAGKTTKKLMINKQSNSQHNTLFNGPI